MSRVEQSTTKSNWSSKTWWSSYIMLLLLLIKRWCWWQWWMIDIGDNNTMRQQDLLIKDMTQQLLTQAYALSLDVFLYLMWINFRCISRQCTKITMSIPLWSHLFQNIFAVRILRLWNCLHQNATSARIRFLVFAICCPQLILI